jgi:two-component system response regulator YesN
MVKVMIVDDEAIVRIGLKSMIDWENHGFQLVGEANDGQKALDLFRKSKPDLVITDLKMPVMDGLELIRRLNELNAKCRVVVLSSYDDYALVREAMKLGAVDYLLKLEMEPDQLLEVLASFKEEILQERAERRQQAQIDEEIQTNISTLRRVFLEEILCNEKLCGEKLQQGLARLGICLDPDQVYCLVFRIGNAYRLDNMGADQAKSTVNAIMSICEEVTGDDYWGYCFQIKEDEFVLLLSPKKPSARIEGVITACQRLLTILEQYLGLKAVIGIGDVAISYDGIRTAYRQANEAIQYRFFKENDQIILWKRVEHLPPPRETYSVLQYRDRIEQTFLQAQVEELCSVFDAIINDFKELHLSQEACSHGALELLSMLCEIIDRKGLSPEEVLTSSYQTYRELLHMVNLSQVLGWLSELKKDLALFIQGEEGNNYPRVIGEAKRYIREHYAEEVTLAEVAAVVGLTPSYFSTVFKEHTGMSYSEYLTWVRLERAKELLKETHYHVYEIGQMVGYTNQYYFNRLFKKITGLTPLDYRKQK